MTIGGAIEACIEKVLRIMKNLFKIIIANLGVFVLSISDVSCMRVKNQTYKCSRHSRKMKIINDKTPVTTKENNITKIAEKTFNLSSDKLKDNSWMLLSMAIENRNWKCAKAIAEFCRYEYSQDAEFWTEMINLVKKVEGIDFCRTYAINSEKQQVGLCVPFVRKKGSSNWVEKWDGYAGLIQLMANFGGDVYEEIYSTENGKLVETKGTLE